MSYFINNIESLLDSITSDDKTDKVYYISENLELRLALKCLQMPVLEKKLIGNAILGAKIFAVQQASQNSRNSNTNKKWLTTERLTEWMD